MVSAGNGDGLVVMRQGEITSTVAVIDMPRHQHVDDEGTMTTHYVRAVLDVVLNVLDSRTERELRQFAVVHKMNDGIVTVRLGKEEVEQRNLYRLFRRSLQMEDYVLDRRQLITV